MKGIKIGLGIFLIAGIFAYVIWYKANSVPEVRLKGIIGSEKSSFLENVKVKEILKNKYGIIIDYSRVGSIEMVSGKVNDDIDFLWPSSQVALELFKTTQADKLLKSELVFNSPMVIYSWDIVVKALITQNIVKKVGTTYYITDMPKLIDLILQNKKWPDIGLTDLYGNVNITTTDPAKSNSGNTYSGLVANILNGEVVNNDVQLQTVLPTVKELFARQGFMQSSSGFLFEQFFKTGVGQYPMIVGYENQIVEFSLMNPTIWPKVKSKVIVLYPAPTVWSEHPLLILNKKANILLDALKDEEIQKIAWEQHGYRTGLLGVQNDTKVIQVDGIPDNINKTVPMPKASIMEKIIKELENNN
jgi:hypothetical protein